jgi:hypothetical protein
MTKWLCCFCRESIEPDEKVHAVTGSSTGGETRMWHAEREDCVTAFGDWLAFRQQTDSGGIF